MSAAERSGVENVEKKSASAVMSISSTKMRNTAFSRRGSIPGASHAVWSAGAVVHVMYASTA